MSTEPAPSECDCCVSYIATDGSVILSFCAWANAQNGSYSMQWNDPKHASPELTSHVRASLRYQVALYKKHQPDTPKGRAIIAAARKLAGV